MTVRKFKQNPNTSKLNTTIKAAVDVSPGDFIGGQQVICVEVGRITVTLRFYGGGMAVILRRSQVLVEGVSQ